MDSQILSWFSDRRFGLEIEANAIDGRDFVSHPLQSGELPKGIDYIADIIQDITKNPVKIDKWHYTHNNNGWVLKPDRSCGIEICTPVCKGWYGLNSICQVLDVLSKDPVIRIDDRCSLHVHVEVLDCTPRELASILAWWIKCEPVFFDTVPINRKISRFCESIGTSDILKSDGYDPMDLQSILAYNKYLSINTYHKSKNKRQTIEFRIMGHEACKDSYVTWNWVRLLLHFVETVKNRQCPRRGSKNLWTGLLWLDLQDVMKILGWSGEYELSPSMTELRNWFLYRIKTNTKTDCSGLWSKEFRKITLNQVDETIKKIGLTEEDFDFKKEDMYLDKFRV